jgi:hypothetical protein
MNRDPFSTGSREKAVLPGIDGKEENELWFM